MKKIKIQCPAKINLTLEVVNKREDGFHNIKSIMQTISLYDYLTISAKQSEACSINLSGTSDEIPYNEKNLVYKAAKLYMDTVGMTDVALDIHIEKNIPVAAGLAGGSTDAAGTIYGLNELFGGLNNKEVNELCSQLGSDLNVCLQGGCLLATSRGEVTKKLPNINYDVTLIKPKNIGISAKEAYTKYSGKENKPKFDMTEKMLIAILDNTDIKEYLYNDLEYAVFDDYKELQEIKKSLPNSIMSGSGSTYFVLENLGSVNLDEKYSIYRNLKFVPKGVEVVRH